MVSIVALPSPDLGRFDKGLRQFEERLLLGGKVVESDDLAPPDVKQMLEDLRALLATMTP